MVALGKKEKTGARKLRSEYIGHGSKDIIRSDTICPSDTECTGEIKYIECLFGGHEHRPGTRSVVGIMASMGS